MLVIQNKIMAMFQIQIQIQNSKYLLVMYKIMKIYFQVYNKNR